MDTLRLHINDIYGELYKSQSGCRVDGTERQEVKEVWLRCQYDKLWRDTEDIDHRMTFRYKSKKWMGEALC